MVKLFLVEDEIIMRKGMKSIDWASRDIELVGDASDGELAYPMILETKPDILLTDIKMPFMDGLELSERVKKELPEIQIIILSGFSEFSYAQKAVSLGVTEYLLKPVTPAKLLEAVGNVKQKIEEARRKEANADYSDGVPEEKMELQRQHFFRHLVMNTRSSAELLDLARTVEINLTARYFSIILMALKTDTDSGSAYAERRNRLQERLEILLAEQNGWTLFDRGENGFAMLVARNHEDNAIRSIRQTLSSICETLENMDCITYYIAVGPMVNRVSEIRHSYERATKALSYRFLTEPNQVVYADNLPALHGEEPDSSLNFNDLVLNHDYREVLNRFMRIGTVEEIQPLLAELFAMMGTQNMKSKLFMTYMVMDMYLTILRFANEMELETEDIDAELGNPQEILQKNITLESIQDYMALYMERILQKRDSKKEGRLHVGLMEAIAYIDDNYQQEDLSLIKVASIANVSPNHFSAIFSQQVGMTFMEYLISKRLEKAKELLMTTDLRSSEIAFQVGYKDPHYFSHTFKKNLGMTPREYRQSGGRAGTTQTGIGGEV